MATSYHQPVMHFVGYPHVSSRLTNPHVISRSCSFGAFFGANFDGVKMKARLQGGHNSEAQGLDHSQLFHDWFNPNFLRLKFNGLVCWGQWTGKPWNASYLIGNSMVSIYPQTTPRNILKSSVCWFNPPMLAGSQPVVPPQPSFWLVWELVHPSCRERTGMQGPAKNETWKWRKMVI